MAVRTSVTTWTFQHWFGLCCPAANLRLFASVLWLCTQSTPYKQEVCISASERGDNLSAPKGSKKVVARCNFAVQPCKMSTESKFRVCVSVWTSFWVECDNISIQTEHFMHSAPASHEALRKRGVNHLDLCCEARRPAFRLVLPWQCWSCAPRLVGSSLEDIQRLGSLLCALCYVTSNNFSKGQKSIFTLNLKHVWICVSLAFFKLTFEFLEVYITRHLRPFLFKNCACWTSGTSRLKAGSRFCFVGSLFPWAPLSTRGCVCRYPLLYFCCFDVIPTPFGPCSFVAT